MFFLPFHRNGTGLVYYMCTCILYVYLTQTIYRYSLVICETKISSVNYYLIISV